MSMKEKIEKFRQDNGNVTYTSKELIGALHTDIADLRVDIKNIQNFLMEGSNKIACNRESLKNIKTLLKVTYPTIIAVMAWLVVKIYGG